MHVWYNIYAKPQARFGVPVEMTFDEDSEMHLRKKKLRMTVNFWEELTTIRRSIQCNL